MNGPEILEALNEQGLTFSDIGRLLHLSPQNIWSVANRRQKSTRVARALCVAIGKPIGEVFPDQPRYALQDPKAKAERLKALQKELAAAGYTLRPKAANGE